MYIKLLFSIAVFTFISIQITAQGPKTYKIYDNNKKVVEWNQLIKECEKSDVVFFGEFHDNTIIHWLQFEMAQELLKKDEYILGMEMFEADQQQILDEYIQGTISQKAFEQDVRKWPNYSSDYAPIVNLAQSRGVSVIATNIPRRYAKLIYRKGEKSLYEYSKDKIDYMPEFPLEIDTNLVSYANLRMPLHSSGNETYLLEAQALKDATMAKQIADALKEGFKMLHLNGKYHSDLKEGIVAQLGYLIPDLKITVISCKKVENIDHIDQDGENIQEDFIIQVNQNVPDSYE